MAQNKDFLYMKYFLNIFVYLFLEVDWLGEKDKGARFCLPLLTHFVFPNTWKIPMVLTWSFSGQWCWDQLTYKIIRLLWIRLQCPHQDLFFLSQQQQEKWGLWNNIHLHPGSSVQSVGSAPDWVILSCSVQPTAYLEASVPCTICLFPTHMEFYYSWSQTLFPFEENVGFNEQSHCERCLGDLWGLNNSLTRYWRPRSFLGLALVIGGPNSCCPLIASLCGALCCFLLDTLGRMLVK